ncbi:MAG TPA: hypothetical protein P5121_21830 [Caldilineaceae bacterium]|nr:hypothetical protein [Caldilineaceae bacterium]
MSYVLLFVLLVACRPIVAPTGSQPDSSLAGGRLAYIGGDGNIYVTDAELTENRAITTDATVVAEGNGRSYHRLAWSPGGQLAYAAVERDYPTIQSELYITDLTSEPVQVGTSDSHFVIYLAWSPAPCAPDDGCRQLAYLIGGDETIDLRLAALRSGVPVSATAAMDVDSQLIISNEVVGSGRPFYFSWSPAGEMLLWHTGGAQRFNPDAILAHYNVRTKQVQPLDQPPGLFQAPAWSPNHSGWVDVVAVDGQQQLRYVQNAERTIVLAEPAYDAVFAWSPDGKKIAFATRRHVDDPFYSPIQLFEIATGTTTTLTERGLHIQAFFWAPDSMRLGYINWLALPDQDWAQWRTINVVSGEDRGFNAFYPSFHMRTMIGSFNQYAQSHRLWSPDGQYLVYADRDAALVERVWLVDTLAPKGTNPRLVDEGAIGIWSWE